jgi:hypothetical protein
MPRAQVILANRSREKADKLAAAMGGSTSVASLADVAAGEHGGNIALVRMLQSALSQY